MSVGEALNQLSRVDATVATTIGFNWGQIPTNSFVMPDSIRHPVPPVDWIADVETPDLIRGRNDKLGARNDKK